MPVMQREDIVPVTYVPSILTAIYQDSPFVYEAYSKFEQRLCSFTSLDVLLAHIQTELSAGRKYFDLAVHYPDTAGYTYIKNIDLIPEKCGGAK